MNHPVQSLIADLNLRRADDMHTEQSTSWASSATFHAIDPLAQLASGGVHEFFSPDASDISHVSNTATAASAGWNPPLTLLAALASQIAAGKYALWVGRRCWPAWYFLQAAGCGHKRDSHFGIVQSIYFDPLSEEQWLDGIIQAARCPAVGLIVASTTGDISLAVGRRLQLAAEVRRVCICLTRPMCQSSGHCWAAARWHIRPRPSTGCQPEWNIELTAKRTARQTNQWTASWHYEVIHGAGYMHISPAMGDRSYTPSYIPAQAG